MKCNRCGKGIGVARRGQVLADGYICYKCLDEIGFDKKRTITPWPLTYREVIGEPPVSVSDFAKSFIKIAHYGEERDLDCTDEEAEIFHIIRSRLDDMNYNTDCLRLVRKSDSYVSAVMDSGSDYGEMDLARFKYTDRAKWIKICPNFEKIGLNSVEDVAGLSDALFAGYRFNEPYL